MGGAASVTGVDSSIPAVTCARENAELNGLAGKIDFLCEDISKFMTRSATENKNWDLVVLDPPKFCPSKKYLERALRKYEKVNAMAMRLVAEGGLLVTCSCSGAVAQSKTFLPMLSKAAARAGRTAKVLKVSGAAEDHLTSLAYPEGEYLTVVTLLVE